MTKLPTPEELNLTAGPWTTDQWLATYRRCYERMEQLQQENVADLRAKLEAAERERDESTKAMAKAALTIMDQNDRIRSLTELLRDMLTLSEEGLCIDEHDANRIKAALEEK